MKFKLTFGNEDLVGMWDSEMLELPKKLSHGKRLEALAQAMQQLVHKFDKKTPHNGTFRWKFVEE